VNSVNPARIQGQKTGAFESRGQPGRRSLTYHVLPVGNAGNITAYWKGYKQYSAPFETANGTLPAVSTKTPVMWGFQAAGARLRSLRATPSLNRTRSGDRHPDRQPGLVEDSPSCGP
jgi:hypothetical protein